VTHEQEPYRKPEERAMSLDAYVASLLNDGKRSEHPDFQALFHFWGKGYITKMAVAHLNADRTPDQTKDEEQHG
jgi:hypothetical protein